MGVSRWKAVFPSKGEFPSMAVFPSKGEFPSKVAKCWVEKYWDETGWVAKMAGSSRENVTGRDSLRLQKIHLFRHPLRAHHVPKNRGLEES